MLKLPQKLTSNYLSVTLNQKKTNRKEFDTENRRVSEIKKNSLDFKRSCVTLNGRRLRIAINGVNSVVNAAVSINTYRGVNMTRIEGHWRSS